MLGLALLSVQQPLTPDKLIAMKLLQNTPHDRPLSIQGADTLLVIRYLRLALEAGYTHIEVDGEQCVITELIPQFELELAKDSVHEPA